MIRLWQTILTLTLLLCVSFGPIAAQTSPPDRTARPPSLSDPPQPYVPTGIPVEELPADRLPTHLNIRLPGQNPDASVVHLASLIAAGRERSAAQPAVVPTEIALLAAGLDNDPALIYDYVRNHYDFLPSWGLLKSPVETYLAKAGNPFDQVVLLATLLQAAGYDTRYVFGTVRIPVDQAMNWAGISNPDVLWYAFAGGGIPSQVTGGNLRMNHVWVKVKVGSTWYPLDASFKPYTSTTGIALPAAMTYDRTDFLNAAQNDSTVATDYVQRINQTLLDGRLTTYASNLLTYLRTNAPVAPLVDVIGGRAIVAQTAASLPTQLPYTVESTAGEAEDIPDALVFKLRVQMPGLDHEVKLTDIGGRRVTVFHVAATPVDQAKIDAAGDIYNVYPAYSVNMKPELRIGGALAATGSPLMLGATERVTITLRTPRLDGQGNPLDFGFSRTFWSSNSYALALGGRGHVYAGTYYKGLFGTTDVGAHWANPLPAAVAAMAVAPGSPTGLYAGSWGGGAYKSMDGGATWATTNTGLGANDVYALAVDPATASTIYAGTEFGVFKSTDGGAHWQAAHSGFAGRVVHALAFAGASLYAGTDAGVFVTTNDGVSWTSANQGLAASEVFALATAGNVIYVGTARGVFVQAGSAGAWSTASSGLPTAGIFALAVHPTHPGIVFAGTGQGVYASANGGTTWQAINDGFSGYATCRWCWAGDGSVDGISDCCHPQAVHLAVAKLSQPGRVFRSSSELRH